MKSSGRSSRGYLSIGQKPGSTNKNRTVFISFSTAKDKSGTQYLVKDNIEKVFCQYVKEGKATIRLKSPQIDLRISKTDAIQLKSFLTVLKGCLQGVSPPPSNQSLTSLMWLIISLTLLVHVLCSIRINFQAYKLYVLKPLWPIGYLTVMRTCFNICTHLSRTTTGVGVGKKFLTGSFNVSSTLTSHL
ncbi:LRR1 [Acanthosepion pharaonis]|uniref:LRR1 n=1 Tax=Acanthosepion pharaonis TaxID=158019 RepID=A0A812CFJ8_ACAPH|nr:LRR1 [Sepia pharaonis]